MIPAIIGLILLLVLILIAVRLISLKRPPTGDDSGAPSNSGPLIHASGIYSIVRNSPREDLLRIRPPESELRKYIESLNEDINKRPLSAALKETLIKNWLQALEQNIATIEKGDAESVEFYYLESSTGSHCPVCAKFFKHGQFVMRHEIYKYPIVIPPFHAGCTIRIIPYVGKENLRETNSIRMSPLFKQGVVPTLPDWKTTIAP